MKKRKPQPDNKPVKATLSRKGAKPLPAARSSFNGRVLREPDKITDPATGRTKLIDAILSNDITLAHRLLDNGASVNKATKEGKTPLHYAARLGQSDMIQLLAESEVDPPLEGALRMVDAETGEELEVTVDRELRRLYRQHLQRSLDDMAAFCRRHGVEYLRASTAIGFEDIVLKYLRQGVHLR